MKNSWKKNLILFWKGWGCSILVAIMIATSFKSAIADWNIVPTGSMKPTIVEGDRVFINKLAYDLKVPYTTWHIAQWGDPERGDIVVFYSPVDNKRLVKRVIGLPGDTIALLDNILFVNGKRQTYELFEKESKEVMTGRNLYIENFYIENLYIENLAGRKHPVRIDSSRSFVGSFRPVTVPEGNYFMMGDNRNNSADSRYFGFVERSRIVGRATAVVVSLDINNKSRPRWERFFTKLP